MENKKTETVTIRDALDKYLNARSLSKSISTLLESKRKTIDYKPYYQRNYVWDEDKATFFIESILLGIEIPPLVMFISANNKKTYEVIDGRQRFETLKRFFDGDLTLKKKGLKSLTDPSLIGSTYQLLPSDIRQIFLETTIRIIEFSTIGEHPNQDILEDQIKKEIFWRYNSGITPLKILEVEKARHLNDNFTKILNSEFIKNAQWLVQFKEIFFTQKRSEKDLKDIKYQSKIRELLILYHFPINIYAGATGRKDTINLLYDLFIEQADEKIEILDHFKIKINLIYSIFKNLGETEWLIYQSIYWILSILEQNKINIQDFLNKKIQQLLCSKIKKNIASEDNVFTNEKRALGESTNKRFQFLVQIINPILEQSIDFKIYLKGSLKNISQKQTDINQLGSMRLERPDAVTKTVEDIVNDMSTNKFLIRPAYQRQEVINVTKASGIIESMLLGIPLPTFFIYRRNDGISEVVDGQQRLLSILGFLGESYLNPDKKKVFSEKGKYPLSKKLKVLTELGGEKYQELDEKWQDKLWECELSFVYIIEKMNEYFDPVDLFIRLNNKPYPVKDHTFEMWNSYSDRTIIEKIKNITKEYNDWFYFIKKNESMKKDKQMNTDKRMKNEELLTVLAYLHYQGVKTAFEKVTIYNNNKTLTFRLPKELITKWLKKIDKNEVDQSYRQNIIDIINELEVFICKIKDILDPLDEKNNEELARLFDQLSNKNVKAPKRQQKTYYILWFLLLGISQEQIKSDTQNMINEISSFFKNNQSLPKIDKQSVKDIFKQNIEDFWTKFN